MVVFSSNAICGRGEGHGDKSNEESGISWCDDQFLPQVATDNLTLRGIVERLSVWKVLPV